MNLPFYIARRYLFSKKKHNAINIISGISVCGVALATLALVCTLSVFNGFQDMVAGFFTAFDPELKITIREGKVFEPQGAAFQEVRSLPEIGVWTETLEENAMVQYKDRQAMAIIKGVEDNFAAASIADRRIIFFNSLWIYLLAASERQSPVAIPKCAALCCNMISMMVDNVTIHNSSYPNPEPAAIFEAQFPGSMNPTVTRRPGPR